MTKEELEFKTVGIIVVSTILGGSLGAILAVILIKLIGME